MRHRPGSHGLSQLNLRSPGPSGDPAGSEGCSGCAQDGTRPSEAHAACRRRLVTSGTRKAAPAGSAPAQPLPGGEAGDREETLPGQARELRSAGPQEPRPALATADSRGPERRRRRRRHAKAPFRAPHAWAVPGRRRSDQKAGAAPSGSWGRGLEGWGRGLGARICAG